MRLKVWRDKSAHEVSDVLVAINGVTVSSVEQVRRLMDKKPKSVALLILHDGERIFVPVELD